MPDKLQIRVYQNRGLVYATEVTGPVELGRQRAREPAAFQTVPAENGAMTRVIVARKTETQLSREHAVLEPLDGNRLRLKNVSNALPIVIHNRLDVDPGKSVDVTLPCRFNLGDTTIVVESDAPDESVLESLGEATLPPGRLSAPRTGVSGISLLSQPSVDSEAVVQWLQSTMRVQQSAATSEDFFQHAAEAVVETVGVDSGTVLMREGDDWQVSARHLGEHAQSRPNWRPSQHLLRRVVDEKQTIWLQPEQSADSSASLAFVEAVVVAPILNVKGEVIGALYGDRGATITSDRVKIKKFEAMLVELLASTVAAGLARLEQERETLALRVQFGQFFSPGLSRTLEENPRLLEARESEITILVADIRGFTRISARLGPVRTLDWIRDTIGALSECVIEHEGVLVDFRGDEVMAMWGAPDEQPDHARRACLAGLAMLEQLAPLNERWQAALDEPVDIGVGVNTGVAVIGNVGTARKFKYGPIGDPVNVASRVQGVTKYLRTRMVISASTQATLGADFNTRRLCTARLVNVGSPVEIYELVRADPEEYASLRESYECALAAFERGEFDAATKLLGKLLALRSDDGPALLLMSRAIQCSTEQRPDFDSSWTPPGK